MPCYHKELPASAAAESLPAAVAARLQRAADSPRAPPSPIIVHGSAARARPHRALPDAVGAVGSPADARTLVYGLVRALLAEAKDALDEALARLDERARQIAPAAGRKSSTVCSTRTRPARSICRRINASGTPSRARAPACDLVAWPDAPIRYVPIPAQTRDAAPFLYYLHYRSPAPFDRLPVHEYVVTPIEAAWMPADEQRGGCAPPTTA